MPPCCVEVIRVEVLPYTLLADAFADLAEGAPRLRRTAFGITLTGERLDLPHYTQPRGLVYLRARLTVSAEWRNCPAPIDGVDADLGLMQINVWARNAWSRENRPPNGYPLALNVK